MAVIKTILLKLKTIIEIKIMGNCCRRKSKIGPISILLLGSESSGKTEIGHVLAAEPRIDFTSTKGVRIFNVDVKEQAIKLMEIGGSDSVRGIWPHYYNETYGVVYVIDCSLQAPFDVMREILHQTMHHKHVRGKPLLIIANKQDLDESIDIIDITYFFRIDEICNRLGTPCFIITSGTGNRSDLNEGMEWLIDRIIENYKTIRNRMRFNGLLVSPVKRFKRHHSSLPPKRHKIAHHNMRVKSAPSAVSVVLPPPRSPKPNGHIVTGYDRMPKPKGKLTEEPSMFKLSPIVIQHE